MTAEPNNSEEQKDSLEESQLEAIDRALAGQQRKDTDSDDLHQLTLALKAERPVARREFKDELDRRAAEGFQSQRLQGLKTVFKGLKNNQRKLLVPAIGIAFSALLTGVLVTSLSDRDTDSSDSRQFAGSPTQKANPPSMQTEQTELNRLGEESKSKKLARPESSDIAPGTAVPEDLPTDQGDTQADQVKDRKVEETASLELTTEFKKVADISNSVMQITDNAKGYVERSDLNSNDGVSSAYLTLRVPSDRLSNVLSEISKLADVTSRNQSTQDITSEYKSASDSLDSLNAQRKSLLKRLERAETETEAESLRVQLSSLKSQIEQTKSQRRAVKNRASFSTVEVSIQTADSHQEASSKNNGWSIGDALTDAGKFLQTVLGVLILVLAALLPILVVGLGVKAVLLINRRSKSTNDDD